MKKFLKIISSVLFLAIVGIGIFSVANDYRRKIVLDRIMSSYSAHPALASFDSKLTLQQKTNGRNVLLIESMSDFPDDDPDDGLITLNTGIYILNENLFTDDKFFIADGAVVQIKGGDAFSHGLNLTSSGVFFSGSGYTSFSFVETFLTCPNGTALDVQPKTDTNWSSFFINFVITDCEEVGTMSGGLSLFSHFDEFSDTNIGFNLTNIDTVSFDDSQMNRWKDGAGPMLTLNGDMTFKMVSTSIAPSSGQSVFDITSTGVLASVVGSPVDDSATNSRIFAVGSLDQTEPTLTFLGNVNIPNSDVTGITTTHDNALVTTITGASVSTRINAIWTEKTEVTDRMSFSGAIATYIGLEDVNLTVNANLTIVVSGGGTKKVSGHFFKNDIIVEDTHGETEVKDDDQFVLFGIIPMSTGDTLEPKIMNDTDATNLTVSHSVNKYD